jgi:choline dehydrogenase
LLLGVFSRSDLFGDYDVTFQSEVAANLTWAQQNIIPSTDPTVLAGYAATYTVGTDIVLKSKVGQVELLLGLTGTALGGQDSIAIQAGEWGICFYMCLRKPLD